MDLHYVFDDMDRMVLDVMDSRSFPAMACTSKFFAVKVKGYEQFIWTGHPITLRPGMVYSLRLLRINPQVVTFKFNVEDGSTEDVINVCAKLLTRRMDIQNKSEKTHVVRFEQTE